MPLQTVAGGTGRFGTPSGGRGGPLGAPSHCHTAFGCLEPANSEVDDSTAARLPSLGRRGITSNITARIADAAGAEPPDPLLREKREKQGGAW